MNLSPMLLRCSPVLAALASQCALPTLALASDPTATSSVPPPAPTPVDTPKPEAPRHTGKGLIIGSAVAGGVGLALNAGRVAWHLRSCRPARIADDVYYGGCLVSAYGDVFLSIPSWFANMASIGLAAGGGALRGKHEAYNGKKRDAKKMIVAGAVMVGVGGTAYIASRFARFAAIGCVARGGFGCYRGVYAGTTIGIQLALSTVAAGAGILAFGDQYKRQKRREIQVAPSIGATFTGLTVSGRF
jgi:hypothetical protein